MPNSYSLFIYYKIIFLYFSFHADTKPKRTINKEIELHISNSKLLRKKAMVLMYILSNRILHVNYSTY